MTMKHVKWIARNGLGCVGAAGMLLAAGWAVYDNPGKLATLVGLALLGVAGVTLVCVIMSIAFARITGEPAWTYPPGVPMRVKRARHQAAAHPSNGHQTGAGR